MPAQNPGTFMVSMGAIIELKNTTKILLLKRSETANLLPNTWDYPLGRIENLEGPHEGLKRILKNKTGLEVEVIKPLNVFHYFRAEKTPENEVLGVVWICQTNHNQVTLTTEHSEYRWVEIKEALDLLENEGMKKDIELFEKETKL
jgi:8-oxo-dGTP diphosphatase